MINRISLNYFDRIKTSAAAAAGVARLIDAGRWVIDHRETWLIAATVSSFRPETLIKQACRPSTELSRSTLHILYRPPRPLARGPPSCLLPTSSTDVELIDPTCDDPGRRRTTNLYWRRPFFPIKIARGGGGVHRTEVSALICCFFSGRHSRQRGCLRPTYHPTSRVAGPNKKKTESTRTQALAKRRL